MKIKFFAALSAFLVIVVSAGAQSGRVEAGINLSNVSVTENGRVNEANRLISYRVGIIGDFKLGGQVFLQPGVLYTGKGSKVQTGTEGNPGFFRQTFNPMYIEVPVNLVVKLPLGEDNRFFIGAGPYGAVGVGGKYKTEGNTLLGAAYSAEQKIAFSDDDPTTLSEEEGSGFGIIRRFDYGLNGIIGVEGKSIVISANYGLGLAKLQSGSNNAQDNADKHRVLSFSLGFKF